MSIRRWHKGKIIILWAWGGVPAAFLIYCLQKVKITISNGFDTDLLRAIAELMGALAIFLILTALTWAWLGGKEGAARDDEKPSPTEAAR